MRVEISSVFLATQTIRSARGSPSRRWDAARPAARFGAHPCCPSHGRETYGGRQPPANRSAIGLWYEDFSQTTDEALLLLSWLQEHEPTLRAMLDEEMQALAALDQREVGGSRLPDDDALRTNG
jgi:hypothetical protein